MNKLIILLLFFVILITMTALTTGSSVGKKSSDNNDSLEAARQMIVDKIMININEIKDLPADSVFTNIQMMKGLSAGNLINAMNKGFSTALGVGCEHCHNIENFASDEVPAKQVSREMMKMSGEIRGMLKNIKGIDSENPNVNCATCHRGSIVPATKVN
ncbi:MAG TPA: photosynthetic reaction center cytochrome c subunit family protein [Ignavibacteria bacterium]|nr:photosynthetic reaction center cytochrome c subunit family protein [Ignavibacteria bacterium]HMR40186.1 photosynthetic reaction center cytochrome c subunit family protein [Ignavibacteria bacterium]